MGRVLHLSDLHLGEPAEWQYLDDHKSRMAASDRRAEKHVLQETLASLTEDGRLRDVDAIVVSGDLTSRARSDGFDEFAELAEMFITHVAPEKVVVVPGNHDVPWDVGPDNPGRYEGFLRATRSNGFATPLLDHIDFGLLGELNEETEQHPHLVTGRDFLIVPINSSHFCWGKEPLEDAAAEELLTVAGTELTEVVEKLRRHDVARVSNAQIAALQQLLRIQDPSVLGEVPDDRVRIAVLHHQLLPVSSREEFKSFESLSNLGAVRELLAALRIDVVLHGHKHESALYWDYVADHSSLAASPHRLLVSAAPGNFRPGRPVARLLEIGDRAGARDIQIVDFEAATRPAGQIQESRQTARLWAAPTGDEVTDAMTVRGESVSEVYARIQSLFDGRRLPINDLVCEVTDPSDSGQVPADYPHPPSLRDVQSWMDDLVEWWQLPEPGLLDKVRFNHGERIYRRWGNQVDRAADALIATRHERTPTTRAVLFLVDPLNDTWTPLTSFPSFVYVQLQLIPDGLRSRLDCTGYFRKQEMRYWWPINVRELALIQEAVRQLVARHVEMPIIGGRLRTVTGQALVEERLPAVAVPAIDRALDQSPETLWRMAFILSAPEKGDKALLRATWEQYLAELDPEEIDGISGAPRISHQGLAQILTYLKWLKCEISPTGKALKELVDLYALVDASDGMQPDVLAHKAVERLATLRTALDGLLGPLDQA
jgi:3',5'-cyclic AMP phosphodiesterase CpdA